MKFISWNTNGLRACLQKGFLDFFDAEQADFFCLQETKMQPEQLDLHLEGYEQYWHSAIKKGYSGTAIFTKHTPLNVYRGMDDYQDDEGRVLTLEYETFFIITCYSPNSQENLARIDYRMDFEDKLRAYMLKLSLTKPVILCGDLNVAHLEIDLKNPKSNRQNPGFSDQEREKFSELLKVGHTDTFRFLYPDVQDAYSWWSYRFKSREKNVGWRIDYFVVSEALNPYIKDSVIHASVTGSDHCPVSLILER
ncbi:MAG: exodeoxyribonuclease III [Oscillospiraceae bacterium]